MAGGWLIESDIPPTSGATDISGKADKTQGLTASEGVQRLAGTDLSADAEFTLDINGLSADASPDSGADYVATWDASASQHKKVLLSDMPGGGGGGSSISFGAYGSRPGGTDGDLYKSTDMPFESIKQSGVWQDFYEGWPITKIDNSSFSWVGQDSSTIDDYGIIHFGSIGNTNNLHVRKKAAPSAPYTLVCKFRPALQHSVGTDPTNYNGFGCGWRESGSGKLINVFIVYVGGWCISVDKQTNTASYSGNYIQTFGPIGDKHAEGGWRPFICFKLVDDNTDRKIYYSYDGGNTYTLLHTVGRTDFLTADEIWFGGQNVNSTRVYTDFISWEVS